LGDVLGGLLLLWGLGWLAVPPLLKTQLESPLQEALGRQVTIGQLGNAAAGPQVAIQRIYIDQVLPKLAFDLNGNRFDSTAQTTPFQKFFRGQQQTL
jgi:hypothetical protein